MNSAATSPSREIGQVEVDKDTRTREPHPPWLCLEQPLSVWSRTLSEVKPENMDDYVNRPSHERKTAADEQGKIKRELNSFMIYRKAYKSVAVEYILGKSQSTYRSNPYVSKLCALSWDMESAAVKDQYKSWAEKERDGHRAAFPNYKYKPLRRRLPSGAGKPPRASTAKRPSRRGPSQYRMLAASALVPMPDPRQGRNYAREYGNHEMAPPDDSILGDSEEFVDSPTCSSATAPKVSTDLAEDLDETSADVLLLQQLDWPRPSLYVPFFEYALFSQYLDPATA